MFNNAMKEGLNCLPIARIDLFLERDEYVEQDGLIV